MSSAQEDPASLVTLPRELLYQIFDSLPTTTYVVNRWPDVVDIHDFRSRTIQHEQAYQLPSNLASILQVSDRLTPTARRAIFRNDTFLFGIWPRFDPSWPDFGKVPVDKMRNIVIHLGTNSFIVKNALCLATELIERIAKTQRKSCRIRIENRMEDVSLFEGQLVHAIGKLVHFDTVSIKLCHQVSLPRRGPTGFTHRKEHQSRLEAVYRGLAGALSATLGPTATDASTEIRRFFSLKFRPRGFVK